MDKLGRSVRHFIRRLPVVSADCEKTTVDKLLRITRRDNLSCRGSQEGSLSELFSRRNLIFFHLLPE